MLDITSLFPLLTPSGDATDWAITGPGTFLGQWQEDLEGMQALSVKLQLYYGSGGTTVDAFLQSSLDQASNAYDIARVTFTTVTRIAMFSVVQSTTAIITPADGGIESEGIAAAILGDRLRLKVVVAGTYANTVLSARVLPS